MAAGKAQTCIWLVPPEPFYSELAAAIAELAERLGAPVFAPHVTVLSNIALPEREIAKAVQGVAARTRPFSITLAGIAAGETVFQSLFVPVAPARALTALRRALARALGIAAPGGYVPHLSLLYGAFAASAKHGIAAELGDRFDGRLRIARLSIVRASSDLAVERWRRLGEIPFGAGRA